MRFLRFNLVGLAGIGVQLGVIAMLVGWLGISPSIATAVGVAGAVIHNYVWHRRWTWADRADRQPVWREFVTFAAANGVVSLAGNVAIVTTITHVSRMGAVPASAVAIVICGIANYWLADRAVFVTPTPSGARTSGPTMSR